MRRLPALLAFFSILLVYTGANAQMAETSDEEAEDLAVILTDAQQGLDIGRYKSAKVAFKKVLKAEAQNQEAARGLAEALDAVGDYKPAIKTLQRVIKAAGDKTERRTRVLLGRLLFNTGRYDECEELVESLLKADKQDIDGLLLRAKLQIERGLYATGKKTVGEMRLAVLAQRKTILRIDKSKGRQSDLADLWCSAGEGYFLVNRLHEANDCWGNALIADEYHLRTNQWMARLYLEQNHDNSARINYAEPTLRHNANSAVLHLRLAQAHAFRWRSVAARKELDTALSINRRHLEALAERAIFLISSDQYDAGAKDYKRALKANPFYMRALAAKGLHGITLGLDGIYAEAEKTALKVNPKPALFYEIIADGLAARFRYTECMPLYKKAIEANPEHWTAYRGQGRAALNTGDDELGKKSLETAHNNDPLRNNLQTVNLLTLLDSYKNFKRFTSEDGRFRLLVHKSEARVMKDLYFKILYESWDAQTKKYGFTPRTPITVEAFHVHNDFEVRTVGITGLPALGACFGQLITLDSPSARPEGSYNWASTLRHEMDHVFQIQLSNGQVPRWLAEGLSSYEEKRARPEWERHMENLLFRHYHLEDIPSVRKFNEWFRDGSKVMFAYYLGNVMCEFIDKRMGGYAVLSKMLRQFGEKKTPEQVFAQCLEMKLEEFDKLFLAYVKERIAHLKMVPFIAPNRMDDLLDKAEFGEATRNELVLLALAYLQKGAEIDCKTWLGLAGKKGASDAKGTEGAYYHYIKARLTQNDSGLRRSVRTRRVKEHYNKAIARGLEDFDTFLVLARTAARERDRETALHYLKEARRAYPESTIPYRQLYQLYQQMREQDLAVEAAESWMKVDENNLGVRLWLIENIYRPGRRWAEMAEMAEQTINVAPLNSKTHQHRAFSLRKLKRWEEAVAEYHVVRKLITGATAEQAQKAEANVLLDIAATWLNAEQLDKARKALAEAKALDPENPRIKTIEEELNDEELEEEFSIAPGTFPDPAAIR